MFWGKTIQQEHMHVSMSFRVQSQMKFLSAKVAETNQQWRTTISNRQQSGKI